MISVNISMNPVSPPQLNGRRDAMMEVDMGGPCLLIHSDHHLLGAVQSSRWDAYIANDLHQT